MATKKIASGLMAGKSSAPAKKSKAAAGSAVKSSFKRAGVRILRPPGEPSFDYGKYVEAARALRRKSAA